MNRAVNARARERHQLVAAKVCPARDPPRAGHAGRYAAMMDPVTLMLLGTAAPAVVKVADALAQSLLLRARAELARAQVAARGQDDKPAGGAQ